MRGGDAIEIEESAIRLEGLHTPELHQEEAEAVSAFMRTVVEGKCAGDKQSGERTRGRRVGDFFLDGAGIDACLTQADLARDGLRFSGGRYGVEEMARGKSFFLLGYCILRRSAAHTQLFTRRRRMDDAKRQADMTRRFCIVGACLS